MNGRNRSDGSVSFGAVVACLGLALVLAAAGASAMTLVHGPRIGLVTTTAATISWDTDTAGIGSVKWGPTSGYGSTLSESGSVTGHRLTISGLAAATTYHYQVVTGTVSSADYTFTTAPSGAPDFTFITMADSRGTSVSADLAGLPQAFTNIINQSVARHAAFVLFGGDMFYGSSTQTTQAQLYDVFKAAIDPLAHTTPFLIAVGNHEMNESSYSTITQFNQEFAQPQTGPSGYGGTAFSFDWANSHYAIVDTSHVSSSCGGTNNCMYYMFDDMLSWLDSDLASAQSRGVRHIFVMGHSHAYADSSWTLNYMGNYPTQRDKFWTTLVNHKADAYICGHIHDFNDALGQSGVVQWLNGNSGAGTGPYAWTLWQIHGDTATATLYDDSGTQVTQQVIQSSQPGTCTNPTVSVTSPTSGATLTGSVTLTASVTASPAATQVQFMVDGSVVGTLIASPWSLAWNSASVANGSHTISANATNTCGTTTSAGVGVTVNNTASTYSISGTITLSGAGLSGVTVTAGGKSATTNASGTYTISGLAAGSYTVAPSLAGYTFSPASQSVTISSANVTGINFTAATSTTHSISGTVSGAVTSGVTMSLTGASSAGTTTGSGGTYTFGSLTNGSYTVTPSLAGYTFSPASQSVTISSANVTGINFTASVVATGVVNGGFESGLTGWTAGGVVAPTQVANAHHSGSYSAKITGGSTAGDSTLYQDVAVPAGATLSFWYYPVSADSITYDWQEMDIMSTSGAVLATPLKVCSNTAKWTNVTYSLTSYAGQTIRLMFKVHDDAYPGYTTYMYVDDVSITAGTTYSISGTITLNSAGLSGVTVKAGSASATTNSSGTYTISGLAAGSYTVTPTLSGYTFSPASQAVTISSANVTGINFTATAATCAAKVVISQVYGGGSNSGAYYKSDFIELFNRGGQAQSLTGWSVQYAAAGGTTWSVTNLSGSIPAGGYYLVQEYTGSTGTALPTADATGTINMSGTNGEVAVVNSTTALSGSCPTSAGIQDKIGYGTASCYEGTAAAPALSNTTSARRASAGCTDTNNNGADFTAVTSNASNPARNSASTHTNCTCQ